MIEVILGNPEPVEGYYVEVDPEAYTADALREMARVAGVDDTGTKAEVAARLSAHVWRRRLEGSSVTTVRVPDQVRLAEAFTAVVAAGGVWGSHSDAASPTWVWSDNAALASLLAEHYGCATRRERPEEG